MSTLDDRGGFGSGGLAARCPAAHDEDPRPCDGPADAVRIVDRVGAEVAACPLHGAVLLASLDRGRVYPHDGPDGSAITVYTRARTLRPFDFLRSRMTEWVR
jgi:hypothetical protein